MLIEKLAQLWSVKSPLPSRADLICLMAFGATKDGLLTRGSLALMQKASLVAARYPEARVAFGAFTLSPLPGAEERLKKQFFRDPIFAGQVVSTIEEAEKIRASLPLGFAPQSIVLVTDEWHSRSAITVWKRIWRDRFPQPDIRVVVVPSSLTVGADNPMKMLRNQWCWALVNVLRQMFLVVVPESIKLMKKLNLHQPT